MPSRRTSMLMTSSSGGCVTCRSLHYSPFTPARAALSLFTRTGKTRGRGKLDRSNSHALSVEDVYLHPLHRDCRHILASPASDLSTGRHRVKTEHM